MVSCGNFPSDFFTYVDDCPVHHDGCFDTVGYLPAFSSASLGVFLVEVGPDGSRIDKGGFPFVPYLYFDEGPWVGTTGFSDRAAGLVDSVRLSFPVLGHWHSRVRISSLPHQEQNRLGGLRQLKRLCPRCSHFQQYSSLTNAACRGCAGLLNFPPVLVLVGPSRGGSAWTSSISWTHWISSSGVLASLVRMSNHSPGFILWYRASMILS